jgi:HEAT repeat protein
VLRDEPDAEIRKIAVRALGQRQNEATAKTFLQGALNDADAGVKTLAQQLLTE